MKKQTETYIDFIKNKVVISEDFGFISELEISEKLFPHQKDVVDFALTGGRRAIFMSFGLGKTFVQLEIAKHIIHKTGMPFLIVMPLGVVGEFKRDNLKLGTGYEVKYITDSDNIEEYENKIYLTNYERIRKGDIDALKFGGVSFDEASILRNLKTQTTNYVLDYFKNVPYRYVATATPTPNEYIEILNYADYLGVISRGHALTRFFQRDSTKAGNLQLYPNKKNEFWQWVSTWACFINSPADLGYNSDGYDLPELHIEDVCITPKRTTQEFDKDGKPILFKVNSKSLLDVSREKRETVNDRVKKAIEIIKNNPDNNFILWHSLESERYELEKELKNINANYRSVYGSQENSVKENNLIDFSNGEFQYLVTKPTIAGSGCNLQEYCWNMIFVGIDYKFNDHIQAIHRTYRFGQINEVNVYRIYTNHEYPVLKALKRKTKQHYELQTQMINLVKQYGFNKQLIKSQMERQIFKNGNEITIGNSTLYNNDSCIKVKDFEENSVDMILTSIPFGDHYEYSDNYNDMGHNHGNENFFKQMNYLTPELLRVLRPGRIAAIHVKDRIRYSYQNGTSFTTIDDFSAKTSLHFQEHGFYLLGKITVTTDVVRENNQTYRLGWSEQCKDATKMGVGLPEYILLFRKAPTESNNAYGDIPVNKSKDEYPIERWQLDAHAYWRSSGDRFMSSEEISKRTLKTIYGAWKKHNKESIYSFQEHLDSCKDLDENGKLSRLFMTLPTESNNDLVWTDINRMNTLNTNQVSNKKEKHICPLQIDIIERLIDRFTMKGETVFDPFMGIGSTAYKAMYMGRKSIGIELNTEYWKDSIFYVKSADYKMKVPTLFDVI